MPPLVSVHIPTRNRLPLLQRALRSVYAQDYPNREILVLDDASEDTTSDYIRLHCPDIRLFRHEEHQGVLAARNVMMREAKGKYLVGLDDDSYFLNTDAISNVVARMEAEPELAIIDFGAVDPEDQVPPALEAEYYTCSYRALGHCIRKAVLQETGYLRELVKWGCEERDLSLRVLDRGYRLLAFPLVTVAHPRFVEGKVPPGSPEYRNAPQLRLWVAKSRLLQAWLNEPFPWWALSTVRVIFLYGAKAGWGVWRGSLAHVLRGFCGAFKDFPALRKTRRPVSSRAMRLYLALGRRKIMGSQAVQSLYQNPPSLLEMMFRQ